MTIDPFLAQLVETCGTHRTRAKWLFVPNHAVGLTIGNRLARESCAWANLRVVTPLDVAVRMAAPFLLERGIDPSEEQLGPALMMRLLLDLPERNGYFRPMARHASMAEALWRAVRELRYAGLRSVNLAANRFTGSGAKRAELVALLAAYEQYLDVNQIADMPTVLQEAVARREWCPIAARDIVLELPDVVWSPLVRQFLDSLPGQRVAARTIHLPEVTIPERVSTAGAIHPEKVERRETETTTGASRLRFLQAVGRSPLAADDGTLDIFHAGGRDAEVDEVCRRILTAGVPLDEVEIVCASPAYSMLVRERAMRLEWPVTVSAGLPAAATRPGRLLLRYCEWVESDFASAELRALLQAGDCRGIAQDEGGRRQAAGDDAQGGRRQASGAGRQADGQEPGAAPAIDDETGLSAGQAARLLLKAEATRGRHTYRLALNHLAARYERRANSSEASTDERAWNGAKEAQTRTLLAWIERVLSAIPDPNGDQVELATVVDAARTFLQANSGRRSALDRVALAALTGALDELRALGTYRCDPRAALRFLRERAASLVVMRDRPRPGHLHVSSLADAGYDGRRLVFIVGLQEGAVFPAVVEDPVLLDDERKAIAGVLRTSTDRQDEAVFAALSRIAAIGVAAAQVCLSFSCRDTRELRETFPSWIVLQAFRLKRGDATLTYDCLKEWLGEPASAVPNTPGQAIDQAGWWLAQAKGPVSSDPLRAASDARRVKAVREAILRTYPSLGSGIRAEAARASVAFTEFDGLVRIAGAALDPSRTGRAVSATTLESAAKCPLRFFMEHGLGVRVIEEGRADDDRWLDAATKGTELHDLFACVMREIRAEERKPSLQIDQPRLRAMGRACLERLREEIPPPSDEVFARESREFLEDLDAFIEAECEGAHGRHPVAFEVSFGLPPVGDEDRLARAEPVTIELGDDRRLVLHGRIDRINRLDAGEYEVIDYKTGTYWPDNWEGEFAGGTRLQHALYGAAAESLLKGTDARARVVRGRYVFPSVKGHGHEKVIPAPSRAKLVRVLRDLSDVIGAGAFVPADLEQSCRWCEFAAACHVGDVGRAERKRDNPANVALEAYRRLRRDHE